MSYFIYTDGQLVAEASSPEEAAKAIAYYRQCEREREAKDLAQILAQFLLGGWEVTVRPPAAPQQEQ